MECVSSHIPYVVYDIIITLKRAAVFQHFKQLVNELKIRKAIYYLEETDFSIENISELVGYNSSGHFYHIFRKIQGISPQQYRNQYLENA